MGDAAHSPARRPGDGATDTPADQADHNGGHDDEKPEVLGRHLAGRRPRTWLHVCLCALRGTNATCDTLTGLMGSLIKKRRKRMRKKKHKKMLKATRWQRRAGK